MDETLEQQVQRLADVIAFEIDGEPSGPEGAIDCAIGLLRGAYADANPADSP